MEPTITDEFGRIFCEKHGRDYCHECCMDFRSMNEMAEEEAGLKKKKSAMEEAAKEYAIAVYALQGMERMVPRPNEAVFEQNRQYRRDAEAKLEKFAQEEGVEAVEAAKKAAVEKEMRSEMDLRAMTQGMARLNPGQTHLELGGPQSQQIYEQLIQPPKTKRGRGDPYTCDYCGKTDTTKRMNCCGRCKTVSYCSKKCQTAAWKAHKKICVAKEVEPKDLPLTWEQLEACGPGIPATGKVLEVRIMLDESMGRQVFSCKDRVGALRRIAAYTNSRGIPGARPGVIVRWKNPRFHYFMDGSSGARIEEEDLKDVTVKN